MQSLLHKDSQFSAMLANNKEIGTIEWSDDLDPHKGYLKGCIKQCPAKTRRSWW